LPSSWIEVAPAIVNTVLTLRPRRVLDLGMGAGKYGFLIREQGDLAAGRTLRRDWQIHIEGVEGYAPTISDHQRCVYDLIHAVDAREFLRDYRGPKYDVCLAIDVIEHFLPEEATALIRGALDVSRYVLISTPRGFFTQHVPGNPLDEHRSWWPKSSLKKLARVCGATMVIAHVYASNVAVFSRGDSLPKIRVGQLRAFLRILRDLSVPEHLYYTLIGGRGPTIPKD